MTNKASRTKPDLKSDARAEVVKAISNDVFGPEPTPPPASPTEIAIAWLDENCSQYQIGRNRQTGKRRIQGTIQSEQAGFYQTYIIRETRPRPPYYIHPEDTIDINRTIHFDYVAMDESLPQAVESIITLYAPGPQVVQRDECLPLQKDFRTFVLVTDNMPLEEFQKLHSFGTYCAQLQFDNVEIQGS